MPNGFLLRLLYVSGSILAVLSSTIRDLRPLPGTLLGMPGLSSPPPLISLSGWLFPRFYRRDDYAY